MRLTAPAAEPKLTAQTEEYLNTSFDKLRTNGGRLIPFVVSLSNHERNQLVQGSPRQNVVAVRGKDWNAVSRRRTIIRYHQATAAALAGASLLFAASASAQTPAGRNLAAACATCHGTNGVSRDGTPALAGMPREQMSVTLKAFRDGQRPATIMNQLAKGYSDAEIEAIATYFASQKSGGSEHAK